MNRNITQNQLIQYIYKEGSAELLSQIEMALILDENLKKEYDKLKEVHTLLNTFSMDPSETTIRILNEEAHGTASLELF